VNSASIYAWSSLAAPQALACYAPQAEAALNDLIAATVDVDDYPKLAAVIRNTCANTLSLPPLITTVANATIDEDMLRSVQAFAEQFSLDVSSLDETLRAPFVTFFGMASTPVAQAIYVADMVPRLRRVLEQLFDSPHAQWPQTQPTANIQTAFFEFVRVVYNLHELDPVTTELVRMRGARQHNCRLCKSLRAYSALEAGVKETQLDAVDHYLESDLTASQKAALTLVDAMIWQPAFIDEHVIADIRQHFTPAQAVELVLDVTRNAANKSIVALDADAAPFDGVQVYNIDAAGNMQVGLQRPN
jgi:alkylhydroperoxidase family enzyme